MDVDTILHIIEHKLNSCRFCKTRNHLWILKGEHPYDPKDLFYYIKCSKCKASTTAVFDVPLELPNLIRRWNYCNDY